MQQWRYYNDYLPLPLEIRSMILRKLLVHHDQLEFYKLEGHYIRNGPPVLTYHLSKYSHTENDKRNHELSDAYIGHNYRGLCLVSKRCLEEARTIFFEENNWCIDFIYYHTRYDSIDFETGMVLDVSPRVFEMSPVLEFLIEHWGVETMTRIQRVVIELGMDYDEEPHEMQRKLAELVGILKDCPVLKSVTVRVEGDESDRFIPSDEAFGGKDGKRLARGSKNPFDDDVQILLAPLKQLSGVNKVSILGLVADDRAEELEEIMMSDPPVEQKNQLLLK